jgi:hypothetical protein
MSYYLRAFCAAPARLPDEVAELLGLPAAPPGADQAEIHYKDGRSPLLAEVWRGHEAREEVDAFLEMLEDLAESAAKRRVADHLQRTRDVVALRLPGDIDDDGYEVAGSYFAYLVDRCEGLIQADGEGFYDGEELILKLE